MISKILFVIENALSYTRRHPQIYLGLLLVIIVPLVFLYTGQQFLDAGRQNQDRLQKEKVGLLHDAFSTLLRTQVLDYSALNTEIAYIAGINPDITQFRIVTRQQNQFIPVSALSTTTIGEPEPVTDLFKSAAVRFDESLIFEFYRGSDRVWQAYRALELADNQVLFIFTEHNLGQIDAVLEQTEREAYGTLIVIYIVVLLIAYWLIKNTDYEHLYKEAKNAIKTKDLFTNMIAHELRAPLTAMRGYSSMIEESSEATAEIKKNALRIRQSSERLLAIVNDLLDVARIQSGKLAIDKSSIDLAQVLTAVVDELQISAKEKGISLKTSLTGGPYIVLADSKRLHQALTNVISNSIKYTKEGQIDVGIEEKGDAYELRVKDTGMGISAAEQHKLFAPFYRVESNDVSTITGTGLGMWITKQLIELMGATIDVESIKGVGTHIVVTLKKDI